MITSDIADNFFPALRSTAAALSTPKSQVSPRDMLAVMMSESGVRANAHNNGPPGAPYEKQYHASGIIQFMPATLTGLGWHFGHERFRQLSATEQLTWALAYYKPYRGHLGSVGGLYTATFLPALVARAGDPAFVLTARDGPLPWAFTPNAVFDANHDYKITVGELESAVARNCRGPRWMELVGRLGGLPYVEPEEGLDLGTTMGLQEALHRLGFDCGPTDGIPGPRTRAAVLAFQKEHSPPLVVDGIYGPRTRHELLLAFATSA
jgi:hypothetical protein